MVSMRSFTWLSCASFALCCSVHGRVAPRAPTPVGTTLSLLDNQDQEYFVNITVGGKSFEVILDTSTTDLWIYAPDVSLNIANDSGLLQDAVYHGNGFASGPIQFAEVQIGGFTIPSQAFIHANKTVNLDGKSGVLGIGIGKSRIDGAIQKAWGSQNTLGRTWFSNVVTQNGNVPAFYDLSPGRIGSTEAFAGIFDIGQHVPGHEDIEKAPRQRLVDFETSKWTLFLSGLSVNGKSHTFGSPVSKTTPPGMLAASLDTSTSGAFMPSDVVDFIYSNIPGSVKAPNGLWYTPCQISSGANVTLAFKDATGQEFPIHPLDLTVMLHGSANTNGTHPIDVTVCQAQFQSITQQISQQQLEGKFDVILGNAFMRNVYTSFLLGIGTAFTGGVGSNPLVQMLPVTNRDDAWQEFEATRRHDLPLVAPAPDPSVLQHLDPTGFGASPTQYTLPSVTSTGSLPQLGKPAGSSVSGAIADYASSPSDSSSDTGDVSSLLNKYAQIAIGLLGANIAVTLILCVISVAACLRGRGPKSRSLPARYTPVSFKDKVGEDPEASSMVHNYDS